MHYLCSGSAAPPKPPRRPSMLTKNLLPGIHEVEPQEYPMDATSGSTSSHPPGSLSVQPSDIAYARNSPYGLPPRAPRGASYQEPRTHQYKDNLPYYQNMDLREPPTGGGAPGGGLNASYNRLHSPSTANTLEDDVFFNLDNGYHGNRSAPASPAKKRIKHVSQV